jgi:N-acetylglucosaminyl-diphospho-decaprenol L-rhamnosyltransferase
VSPVVTIVIVAHSVRPELERCLDSIRAHAGVPVETIVIDNASTDGTAEWLAEAYPEVAVERLPRNVGVAAREYGLRRARGRQTMFLDSDAALTEGALPAMVEALDRHPDWGLLGPRLVYDDGRLQPSCRRFPPVVLPVLRRPPLDRVFGGSRIVARHLMEDFDHGSTRPVLYVLGACQLFRTDLGQRAGPFPRMFLGPDDIEWCIRIRDAGGDVVYFPEATIVHSYRRLSHRRPVSRAAWRHLAAYVDFQWRYRRRRAELARLEEELDRRAA